MIRGVWLVAIGGVAALACSNGCKSKSAAATKAPAGSTVYTLSGGETVQSAAFSPDGSTLAVSLGASGVRLGPADGALAKPSGGDGVQATHQASFSADGRWLVAGADLASGKHGAVAISVADRSVAKTLEGTKGSDAAFALVAPAATAPKDGDPTYAIVLSSKGGFTSWSLPDGQVVDDEADREDIKAPIQQASMVYYRLTFANGGYGTMTISDGKPSSAMTSREDGVTYDGFWWFHDLWGVAVTRDASSQAHILSMRAESDSTSFGEHHLRWSSTPLVPADSKEAGPPAGTLLAVDVSVEKAECLIIGDARPDTRDVAVFDVATWKVARRSSVGGRVIAVAPKCTRALVQRDLALVVQPL
jgi:hypothetical protein